MRLIDADKVPYKKIMLDDDDEFYYGVTQPYIDRMPTVDAVPVVRCKDCKHFVISEGVCALLSNNYEPPVYCGDEDFCSWGRRKERKGGAEE